MMYLVVITDKNTEKLRIFTNQIFTTLQEAEDFGKRSKLKKKDGWKAVEFDYKYFENNEPDR
ncbi:hypothetical protein [uncultured Mediterranean phage uvMED]|jgi:hypothetical protein|nr:hypothetical protein [uncultured Mediterranean phage uvMED]